MRMLGEAVDLFSNPSGETIGSGFVVPGDVVLDLDQILPGRLGISDPHSAWSAARPYRLKAASISSSLANSPASAWRMACPIFSAFQLS